MVSYTELVSDLPSEYEKLKQNVHRFATEVMRPAAVALDRMSDPCEVTAPDSPLRRVLRAAWGLGYHAARIPVEYDGLACADSCVISCSENSDGQRGPRD